MVREIFMTFVHKAASFIVKDMDKVKLITPESNPDLINEVKAQMVANDTQQFTNRLLELEKAVNILALRQKELITHIHDLEKIIVAVSTTLEEMLHSMESLDGQDMGEEDEEDGVDEAWGEAKKGSSSLN